VEESSPRFVDTFDEGFHAVRAIVLRDHESLLNDRAVFSIGLCAGPGL
jgi:hypothetical protein